MESIRHPEQLYIEPFVGAANVIAHMSGNRKAYDAHPDLILMWNALKQGWRPPDFVTPELHASLRHAEPSALRAFVGFGCSFGGKFFGGYARSSKERNFAASAIRSLDRKMVTLRDVTFERGYFHELEPKGALIYCDPPYAGTASFSVGKFDHGRFWEKVREWSRENTVIVSECSAPEDFSVVKTITAPCGLRRADGSQKPRNEFLFQFSESIGKAAVPEGKLKPSRSSYVRHSVKDCSPACRKRSEKRCKTRTR